MYVKKDELRAAIVARISDLQTNAPERVKTAMELRNEWQVAKSKMLAEHAEAVRALIAADPSVITRIRGDFYRRDELSITVALTPVVAASFEAMRAELEILEAKAVERSQAERAEYERSRRRREPLRPTTVRELEAWLTRIDNDIKTATVSITRSFADELRLT